MNYHKIIILVNIVLIMNLLAFKPVYSAGGPKGLQPYNYLIHSRPLIPTRISNYMETYRSKNIKEITDDIINKFNKTIRDIIKLFVNNFQVKYIILNPDDYSHPLFKSGHYNFRVQNNTITITALLNPGNDDSGGNDGCKKDISEDRYYDDSDDSDEDAEDFDFDFDSMDGTDDMDDDNDIDEQNYTNCQHF